MVVAPCDVNTLAKVSAGTFDDLAVSIGKTVPIVDKSSHSSFHLSELVLAVDFTRHAHDDVPSNVFANVPASFDSKTYSDGAGSHWIFGDRTSSKHEVV